MTDKELIQVYRECSRHPRCEGCPMDTTEREKDCPVSWFDPDDMVNRMEALLAENERLKADKDTNVPIKWVSVEERLPDKSWNYLAVACDEGAPSDERIWGCRVVVVADYSLRYNTWTWDENGTEYDLTGLVTHWQPLPELPSTEGVE